MTLFVKMSFSERDTFPKSVILNPVFCPSHPVLHRYSVKMRWFCVVVGHSSCVKRSLGVFVSRRRPAAAPWQASASVFQKTLPRPPVDFSPESQATSPVRHVGFIATGTYWHCVFLRQAATIRL